MYNNRKKVLFLTILLCVLSTHYNQNDIIIVEDSIKNIIPVFTTTVDLLDNKLQLQDISGLLRSSRDVMEVVEIII